MNKSKSFTLFDNYDDMYSAGSATGGRDGVISLYELNSLVSDVMSSTMPGSYWVSAELMEIRESRGHCYMELVQKDAFASQLVAKASAKCWASSWQRVQKKFYQGTGGYPRSGMNILVKVHVEFHAVYGFSLIVSDIDPTYTLGDMARKRQEIVNQLKSEGVYDLQRELQLPLFCQRIAVISSATAAGYGDFCHQLEANEYGLSFAVTLFQAAMQGSQVEPTVIEQLNKINDRIDEFDCVVIIRGGGATSDMSDFDSLLLAENVANFPLPIITGIGHDRDECVLDLISYQRVKTPTAAAAFLISHLAEAAIRVEEAKQIIFSTVPALVDENRKSISQLAKTITSAVQLYCTRRSSEMSHVNIRIENAVRQQLVGNTHRLQLLSQRILALDPQLLLQRGYTMTVSGGRILTSASQLKKGDEFQTVFKDGSVTSVVKNTAKKEG